MKDALCEKENQMFVEDKLVADTEDRKNALEEYIYEMRGKIDDVYAEFANEQEKTKLKDLLEKTEVRLFDKKTMHHPPFLIRPSLLSYLETVIPIQQREHY